MRNPRLRARFFAPANGPAIPKAPVVRVAQRREVFAAHGWMCTGCGIAVEWLRPNVWPTSRTCGHVDHVFPRARGGQNDLPNLTLLCEYCNLSKAADA